MQKFRLYFMVATVFLAGCSNYMGKIDLNQETTQSLYQKGEQQLKLDHINNAIKYLEALQENYPQSIYREKATINLAYSYYQKDDALQTLVYAERYLRQNPQNRENVAYVVLTAGITNLSLGNDFMQDIFKVNRASRETKPLIDAYNNFDTLIRQIPDSKYVPKAKQYMAYIEQQLAHHELEVVKFYSKRKAYVAVVNRASKLIANYPKSPSAAPANKYLAKAYSALKLEQEAQNSRKIQAELEKIANKQVAKPDLKLPLPPFVK